MCQGLRRCCQACGREAGPAGGGGRAEWGGFEGRGCSGQGAGATVCPWGPEKAEMTCDPRQQPPRGQRPRSSAMWLPRGGWEGACQGHGHGLACRGQQAPHSPRQLAEAMYSWGLLFCIELVLEVWRSSFDLSKLSWEQIMEDHTKVRQGYMEAPPC